MILGIDKVLERGIVSNLCERELSNPEGTGVDVRIGELHIMEDGRGHLHKETRKSPDYSLVGTDGVVLLEPGKFYVGKTMEVIDTPSDIVGRFFPRGNLFKSGIVVLGDKTDPGYKGEFTFCLKNMSDRPFSLEIGARIGMMMFYQIDGSSTPYRGQWQGGRTHIREAEKQV